MRYSQKNNIVSNSNAVIKKIVAENGSIVREVNEYVNKGDILISSEIKLNDDNLIDIVRNINGTFTHVEFIKFNSFAQESKNIVNSIIKAMQSTFCDFETSAALITHLNNHFGLPLISVTADVNVVRNPYHTDTIGTVKIDRDGIVEIYSNTEDQQQEIIQLLENLDKSCYSIVDE